jgi:hypothetical protein
MSSFVLIIQLGYAVRIPLLTGWLSMLTPVHVFFQVFYKEKQRWKDVIFHNIFSHCLYTIHEGNCFGTLHSKRQLKFTKPIFP